MSRRISIFDISIDFMSPEMICKTMAGITGDIIDPTKYQSDSSLIICTVGDMREVPGFWNSPEIVDHLLAACIGRFLHTLQEVGYSQNELTKAFVITGNLEKQVRPQVYAHLTAMYGQERATDEQYANLLAKIEANTQASMESVGSVKH